MRGADMRAAAAAILLTTSLFASGITMLVKSGPASAAMTLRGDAEIAVPLA